jgi:hypothetical protein
MNGKTAGNLILMTTICIVVFWIFMALRPANAQIMPGPNLTPQGLPFLFAPRFNYLGPPAAIIPLRPLGYGPPPFAYAPPPPLAYAPPEPSPPPVPLGWIWGRLAPCAAPDCGILTVQVSVDGANVRATPGGPVIGALANGVPIVPLQKVDGWVLVAPACPLMPTYTWSITGGGVPLSVCGL